MKFKGTFSQDGFFWRSINYITTFCFKILTLFFLTLRYQLLTVMVHFGYQTITCLPPSPGSWVSDPDFRPEVTCPPLWSPDPPPSWLIPFPPLKQKSKVTCVPLWSLNPPPSWLIPLPPLKEKSEVACVPSWSLNPLHCWLIPFHLSKRTFQERISLSWSLDPLLGWLNEFLQFFLRLVQMSAAILISSFSAYMEGKGHKPLHGFKFLLCWQFHFRSDYDIFMIMKILN